MRRLSSALFIMLGPLAVTAGCAARGPFPSLAPRAVERELAEADERTPAAAVIADDPALASRVAGLLADAKAGEAEFQTAFATLSKTTWKFVSTFLFQPFSTQLVLILESRKGPFGFYFTL